MNWTGGLIIKEKQLNHLRFVDNTVLTWNLCSLSAMQELKARRKSFACVRGCVCVCAGATGSGWFRVESVTYLRTSLNSK